MNATDYQTAAARTLIAEPGFEIRPADLRLIWDLLRLAGAVAGAVELAKKGIFHQHGLSQGDLDVLIRQIYRRAESLLDRRATNEVRAQAIPPAEIMWLWNVTGLVGEAGEVAGAVLDANIDKLKARYPSGYTAEDSLRRVDTCLA